MKKDKTPLELHGIFYGMRGVKVFFTLLRLSGIADPTCTWFS